MTRIVDAKDGIEEAVQLVRKGELVVFPTETVYGLGANAFDEKAVSKIFRAKGRPQDNPLIVHISSLEQINDIAVGIPPVFFELAEKYMPGPLTVILQKSDKIPDVVTAGGDTVGVRMPRNEWARQLISKSFPLAAPSANRSKHISPTTAKHVYEDLNGEVSLILDGGSCDVGIESTVLDLTSDVPTILRPGAVTASMLADIVGSVSENGKIIKTAKAPGMKYTHYAPVVETISASTAERAAQEYDRQVAAGKKPVLVFRDIYRDIFDNRDIISLGVTVEDYTRNIYNALHMAEKEYDYIIVERLYGEGLEASVMNRVTKAAGGKSI